MKTLLKFFKRILGFFHPVEEVTMPDNVVYFRPKKQRRNNKKTLSQILDGIDYTFSTMTSPVSASYINADVRIGLRRLGTLVDFGKTDLFTVEPETVKNINDIPFTSFVSQPSEDHEKYGIAASIFCVKLKKLPPYVVSKGEGVYLHCGVVGRYSVGKVSTTWDEFYATVKPSGEVVINKQICQQRQTAGKWVYYQKVSGIPAIYHFTMKDQAESILSSAVARCLNIYHRRKESWNVRVRKGKETLVFLIPDNEAKHFFKDRDKTVTVNGTSRRIIHHVSEHQRRIGDKTVTVKEHLRGERVFAWNGHHCSISAPGYHFIPTITFNQGGEDPDDIGYERAVGMTYVSKRLVNYE